MAALEVENCRDRRERFRAAAILSLFSEKHYIIIIITTTKSTQSSRLIYIYVWAIFHSSATSYFPLMSFQSLPLLFVSQM